MNYDATEIPDAYDRARSFAPGNLERWLELLGKHVPRGLVSNILDLGCGTGRFSEALATHFHAKLIGIDPSRKMLGVDRQKAAKDAIAFVCATADALPIADAAIDVVFMSMVFHHIKDKGAATRECRRVLRDGGRVWVRNSTQQSDFPHRHFFPGMKALIESELSSRDGLIADFAGAGFKLIVHEAVTQVVATDWPTFVEKSSLRADSFLARLSARDFDLGIAALRDHARKMHPREQVTEVVDLFVFGKSTF